MPWKIEDDGDELRLVVNGDNEPVCLASFHKAGRLFRRHFPLDEEDTNMAKVILYERAYNIRGTA